MTDKEFELLVQKMFSEKLKTNFGKEILVDHQRKFKTTGGNFKMDLSYSFTLLEQTYLTLVECKYWNSYVGREKVGYFKSIMDEVGANKGVMVTTRGFQSGAITYAQKHNIGLVKITNDDYFEQWSHFDGAIKLLSDKMNSGKSLNPNEHFTSFGIFTPKLEVHDFIAQQYGKELIDILDDKPGAEITKEILEKLLLIPENWYEPYTLIETAGLGYKLKNEPDLRILNMLLFMIKFQKNNK